MFHREEILCPEQEGSTSAEHRAVWGKFLGERGLLPLSPWMARGALCVCTTDWPWAGVTMLGDGTLPPRCWPLLRLFFLWEEEHIKSSSLYLWGSMYCFR